MRFTYTLQAILAILATRAGILALQGGEDVNALLPHQPSAVARLAAMAQCCVY
jgi:hypothetical protein